jgi:uncharacterized protein
LVTTDLTDGTISGLYNLFFLVSTDEDERALVDAELAHRKRSIRGGSRLGALQLNISETCNLKCNYCFADRVDETSPHNIREARTTNRMMSREQACSAIDGATRILERHKKAALVVKFFGREPLMNWPLIDTILTKYGPITSPIAYRFAITTNGTLINEDIARRFRDSSVHVVISLDGLIDANAERLTRGGKSSFDCVDAALRTLRQANVSCSVASVLSPANFHSVNEDFIEYLESRSVRELEIKILMLNQHGHTLPVEAYAEKLVHLHRVGRIRNILVTGDWHHPFVGLMNTFRPRGHGATTRLAPPGCSASEHQLSVEPGGEVFPCRAMRQPLSLSGQTVADAVECDAYVELAMRTYGNVPFCHGCSLEGLCQGVCLGHVEEKCGTIYTSDSAFCEIYRKSLELLIQDELDRLP